MKIGVFFGSRSVEHDISIISAQIVIHTLSEFDFEVIPIYITKKGEWIFSKDFFDLNTFKYPKILEEICKKCSTISIDIKETINKGKLVLIQKQGLIRNKKLEIDIAFPVFHGTFGEDGSIQGLFEILNIPYVGFDHFASSIAMDKVLTKQVLKSENIQVIDYLWFKREENIEISLIEQKFKYPIFVKPAHLGSSIGITKAKNIKELKQGINLAFELDNKIIIEQGILEVMDVNCAIIGDKNNVITSELEEPLKKQEFLSFEDKYIKGSMRGEKGKVRIPAPLSSEKTQEIKKLAIKTWKVIGGYGIARIDFLIDKKSEKIYINEINPMPGSLQKHLWEKSGLNFSDILKKLIKLAIKRQKNKSKLIRIFPSSVLFNTFEGKLKL